MTTTPESDETEMPGQLDLLEEIPGETRGTKKCRTGGKDKDNEYADNARR
ncbi:hypothetical protein AAFP32_04535 [Brevibacterium sp. CBA3109]|uniref:Uncharacterized protein n=1 Tax=Brevibacterium koreense TaxID=3140787 RepID=A0AAU7UMW2_9MICO